MIDTIYVERAVADHPRTRRLLERFVRATVIECDGYGEVFNRHRQSFRIQKQRPSLILARKDGQLVLEAPASCRIDDKPSHYFSHMLNCLYDCRYCFLQGMLQSAHYLLFVNYEDFEREISAVHDATSEETLFFSGFDCDSLALDDVTRFADHFIPFFATLDRAWLELRTKSVKTSSLLAHDPLPRGVVAFSLSPDSVARAHEHGAPPVARRIRAMRSLAEAGWRVGARFDPVLYTDGYAAAYRELFGQVFAEIPHESIHSVTLGPLRFPKSMFDRIVSEYPDELLFAQGFTTDGSQVTLPSDLELEIESTCLDLLREHIDVSRIYCPTREARR